MSTQRLYVLVMGASGSGKTTIGKLIAQKQQRGSIFIEGDDFHSTENINKMRQGIALTDKDREQWLKKINSCLLEKSNVYEAGMVVVACSALKSKYRDILLQGIQPEAVCIVFLEVSKKELQKRVDTRNRSNGHFMPVSLVESQLATLEIPVVGQLSEGSIRWVGEEGGKKVLCVALQEWRPEEVAQTILVHLKQKFLANDIMVMFTHAFGSGPIQLMEWQSKRGNFLAVASNKNQLELLDRRGTIVEAIDLAGKCTAISWHPEGDLLGILQEESSSILFWDAIGRRLESSLDSGMKMLTCMSWSPDGTKVIIGNAKGNILIFDFKTTRKIPVLGKHAKGITSAVWWNNNILATASVDKTFTLTNEDGDTILSESLKGDPSQLQFSTMKTESPVPDPVLSMALSLRTLYLYNTNKPHSPIELAFQSRYGSIVTYRWYGDGYVMIGFSSGYLVVISTNVKEIGQEMFQSRNHKDSLNDIAISTSVNKAATCGDNCIKLLDLVDLKDVYAIETLDDERGMLDKLRWSDDGQFLTVGTKNGTIYTYLTKLPAIADSAGSSIIFLTSLLEITISNQQVVSEQTIHRMNHTSATVASTVVKQILELEPSVLALGKQNFAAGVGNKAYYFALENYSILPTVVQSDGRNSTNLLNNTENLKEGGASLILCREYVGTIQSICMNGVISCVLLNTGKVIVHAISGNINPMTAEGTDAPGASESLLQFNKVLPEDDAVVYNKGKGSQTKDFVITCIAITDDFIIYGTKNGILHHYSIVDWIIVNEFRHKYGITKLYPQPGSGTKVIFTDDVNEGYIYNPVEDVLLSIPNFSAKTQGVLWESLHSPGKYIFVAYDDAYMHTFVYYPFVTKGSQCQTLGTTKLPFGLKPILLCKGVTTCQTTGGSLSLLPLSTHDIKVVPHQPTKEIGKTLQLLYIIGRTEEWENCSKIKDKGAWRMLAEMALYVLDIQTAIRIYRMIGLAGMVSSLKTVEDVEDRALLAGHIMSFLGDNATAQDFFLASSYPIAALELRRMLLQWDQALTLAEKLDPQEITFICKEYAQQLEVQGQFSEALEMFKKAYALSDNPIYSPEVIKGHQFSCQAGIIKMTLKTGNFSQGIQMVTQSQRKTLIYDCANILESMKQFTEAGMLYEQIQVWEKAADNYTKAKNYTKVGELLPKVNSAKIFLQYAKAKEAEKKYQEAVEVYERVKDFDSAVRIYVENLQNIDAAVNIVRKTRSRQSAKLVFKFLQSIGDYKSVVEFCLMAGLKDEAFELAQVHNVMEYYAELVEDEASLEMLKNIAVYFETKQDFLLAGKYYMKCENYSKALKLLLNCPLNDGKALEMAIDVVGLAKNDLLTHELIDYLMGEKDGIPKDTKYIFKLYMSLGQYKEAARTAIIIAREEQTLGNYRVAHDLLLENFKQLKKMKIRIQSDLERTLMLLHSYIIVKSLVRAKDHVSAARMLIRVSNNISRFPAHVIPILTSTVIECHKAGLKRSSFDFAAMLMRPEYRLKIEGNYRRKIEGIVRRPVTEEEEEPKTHCPFCDFPIPETGLDCSECKNHLPYCIITGKHMLRDDWSSCPRCEFPALCSALKGYLANSAAEPCPMCGETISLADIVKIEDPTPLLKQNLIEDDNPKK